MISALTGELLELEESKEIKITRVSLRSGPIVYELLVPAADVETLRAQINEEITFHTIFYLEGTAGGGNLDPKLIGFLRAPDRQFFNLFTTVKGIGPKTALRALSVPIGEIAQAIESKDARALVKLDGIGKRTAELIIAELAGKTQKFATAHTGQSIAAHSARYSQNEEDAISAMAALGERRPDAERLLERVKHQFPETKSTDALLREMLRMRGSGK
jgi:Holliday junction DNA helicase RuvA